jgi:hypothetical protein
VLANFSVHGSLVTHGIIQQTQAIVFVMLPYSLHNKAVTNPFGFA